MNLKHISAVIRPRSVWEAIDLGFRMARSNYGTMLVSTITIALPILLLSHLLLGNWPFWASTLFWWLKPLWERCNLYILSQSLFGDAPTVKQTLRAFPRYGFSQWLPWLTFRRFSPSRSLVMPLTQLERISGPQRNKRLEILSRGKTSTGATWLTVVAFHIESFLALAAFALIVALVPEQIEWESWGLLIEDESSNSVFYLLPKFLYFIAAVLVAPFYVAGGFALYINRRTILEGWDIEIAFRRLAARVHDDLKTNTRQTTATLGSVGVALIFTACLINPTPFAHAAENLDIVETGKEIRVMLEPLDSLSAHESIEEVVAGGEFHLIKTFQIPRFLFDLEFQKEDEPAEWEGLVEFLKWLASAFASVTKVLLIALGLGGVGWLLFHYRNSLPVLSADSSAMSRRARQPTFLLGMDVSVDSIPTDVVSEVMRLWRTGDKRSAFSTLYRATLVELMNRYAVEFGTSFTEKECMAATRARVREDCADYFLELTRHWQLLAYGHRMPQEDTVRSLCETWGEYFGASDAERDPIDGR